MCSIIGWNQFPQVKYYSLHRTQQLSPCGMTMENREQLQLVSYVDYWFDWILLKSESPCPHWIPWRWHGKDSDMLYEFSSLIIYSRERFTIIFSLCVKFICVWFFFITLVPFLTCWLIISFLILRFFNLVYGETLAIEVYSMKIYEYLSFPTGLSQPFMCVTNLHVPERSHIGAQVIADTDWACYK